jgi:hypothetical protein
MRNVWIGTVAALAFAAGLAAQTSTSPATTSTQQTGQNTVTVTGCLQAADSMGAATTGTAGSTTPGTSSTEASRGSDRFVLNNATMGSAASRTGTSGTTATGTSTAGTSTAGTSTAGTSTAGAARTAGSSYMLDGNASELRRHINHQVEITGRLDSSASASRPATAGGTTSTASTSTPAAGASQTLRVESVKMLSATCSTP